jgi:hypothetical protein
MAYGVWYAESISLKAIKKGERDALLRVLYRLK